MRRGEHRRTAGPPTKEQLIINLQHQVPVNVRAARALARRLSSLLRLGRREFNVCFVDDAEIKRLNAIFRNRPRPTDVLAFAWQPEGKTEAKKVTRREFADFLGDVVISAPAAQRYALRQGYPTQEELHLLILHGLLHLLGYDHESDRGEMKELENRLGGRLGIRSAWRNRRRPVRSSRAERERR